jgi:hypothetical protein
MAAATLLFRLPCVRAAAAALPGVTNSSGLHRLPTPADRVHTPHRASQAMRWWQTAAAPSPLHQRAVIDWVPSSAQTQLGVGRHLITHSAGASPTQQGISHSACISHSHYMAACNGYGSLSVDTHFCSHHAPQLPAGIAHFNCHITVPC